MNTTLATPGRHESIHEHETRSIETQAVRRVGIVDRAALHLGIALITWGRRPAPARERRANRVELALLHRDRRFALASLAGETAASESTRHLAPLH